MNSNELKQHGGKDTHSGSADVARSTQAPQSGNTSSAEIQQLSARVAELEKRLNLLLAAEYATKHGRKIEVESKERASLLRVWEELKPLAKSAWDERLHLGD